MHIRTSMAQGLQVRCVLSHPPTWASEGATTLDGLKAPIEWELLGAETPSLYSASRLSYTQIDTPDKQYYKEVSPGECISIAKLSVVHHRPG